MNGPTRDQLWQTLCQQGLAQGEMPAVREGESPWYVRTMLGVAGWIGALFLLGFVGAAFAFVMKSASASLMLGAACCVAAYFLFNAMRENDFGTQFALAVSLAGQAMVIVGLFAAFDWKSPVAYLLAFAFEAVLAGLIPNTIHRVLTSWGAVGLLWFGLHRLGIYGVSAGVAAVFAMIWLDEARWAGNGALWRPIGFGIALGLLQIDGTLLFGGDIVFSHSGAAPGELARLAPRIGAALVAAVFMGSVWRLLARENIAPDSRTGACLLVAAAAVAAFSFAAHGVTTALLVLLLGYAAGSRLLVGLGLFALGAFLSHYYYQMHTTLLLKSMMLAIAGAVLLGGRMLLHMLLAADKKGERDA